MKRVALALAVLLGCHLTDPEPMPARLAVIPVNAREFAPPALYAAWSDELAVCLGVPAPSVDAIRWAQVDAILTDPPQGAVAGWYIPASDGGPVVYLIGGALYTRFAVKHELMHHLIDDPWHTDPRWGRCTEGRA